MNILINFYKTFILIILLCILGCVNGPKIQKNNLCHIFKQKPKWYNHAYESYKKWGIPVYVIMAIICKESGFDAKAKPPRTTCLFIFPGPRISSAYGYSQAIDSTWKLYQQNTGNRWASRDNFEDTADFIGWYCHISHVKCNISKHDAYNLYLAYHEGQAGFNKKTYIKKPSIIRFARSVKNQAKIYKKQLVSCEGKLQKSKGCCLWPF